MTLRLLEWSISTMSAQNGTHSKNLEFPKNFALYEGYSIEAVSERNKRRRISEN